MQNDIYILNSLYIGLIYKKVGMMSQKYSSKDIK